MAALFGNGSDGRREPKSLVEFRAGKMTLSGTTVTADTRKGLVYMKQEDRLMHFYWKDRKNGEVVDDFILFPGEVEYKQVDQCSTGRVFILKFRDRADRKYFYWMQEPKESKDEELQKKVNDLINNPPDPSQALSDGGLQSLMGGHGPSLQSLLTGSHTNPQLLEQLINSGALSPLQPGMFEALRGSSASTSGGSGRSERGGGGGGGSGGGGGGSSTTSQHTPARSQPQQQQEQQQSRPHQVQLGDLQNILSSMNIPSQAQEDKVSLTDVVNSEALRPLSNDPSVREQVESHLPSTSEGLETVLTSPQFQQALGTFNSALESGQLGPLMSQFGLSGEVVNAATTGNVVGFAQALQNECGDGTTGAASDADAASKETKKESEEQGGGGEGEQAPPSDKNEENKS